MRISLLALIAAGMLAPALLHAQYPVEDRNNLYKQLQSRADWSERDRWILLTKIQNKNDFLQDKSSAIAVETKAALDKLSAAHPEFGSMQDFRLDSEIAQADNELKLEQERLRRAQRWIPKDKYPISIRQFGRRAIASYNYRLEFYELPNRVDVIIGKDRRQEFFREGRALPHGALKPGVSLTFQHRVSLHYDLNALPQPKYFLCLTLPLVGYSPKDPNEREILRPISKSTVPWVNPSGTYDDFVGIITVEGRIVYQFPVKQQVPGLLVRELATSPDGRYAAIMIGEKVQEAYDDSVPYAANPREVWTWEYPDKLRKFPVSGKTIVDLRAEYRNPPK